MNIKNKRIKILFLLIGIAMNASINAQDNVPLGIKYQAVARDDNGKPMIQRDIVAKMQIVQMDKDVLIWEELHYTTTNEFGLFQLIIGKGYTTGEGLVLDFESINWGKASLALQVELDFGKGFLNMGIAMLQSVPYALLADSVLKAPLPDMELGQLENVSIQKPTKNQPLVWNGKEWLPGDSLKVKNLLTQGALKIGDSDPITGVTADTSLSDVSGQTIPTSKAIKSYVDNLPVFQGGNTDEQDLSLSGTLLSITNGTGVDLSSIQDGTEDADADPSNELQDLSLTGTNLSISNGSVIDLGNINTDDQNLILNDHLLTIEGGNAITLPDNVDDLDADPFNELQDISLSNTLLSISNGSTIDLAPAQDGYEPNTDNQSLSVTGHQLSIEDGNSINLPDDVDDADADPSNEIQDISLSSTFLSITSGSTIDLTPAQDGYEPDTDEQNLFLNDHQLTIEDGNTITLPDNVNDADADPANELQELSITDNTIYISNGNSIDLPGGSIDADADPTNEIQDLQLVSNTLTITNNSNATPISLAQYIGENTDNQNLSLSGTDLSISGGNSVDLASLPDEVDDADADPGNEIQDISLTGTNLSISDGSTVNLSVVQDGYEADTDDQNLGISGHLLSIEDGNTVTLPDNVNDADADPANELQDISLSGTNLSIDNGSTVDLSLIQDGFEANTDDQNLILNGHLLTIESGNTITLPDNVNDADADPANELQDISLSGTNLSITNGSTVDLGNIDTDTRLTEPEVDAFVANNGYLTIESDPIFSTSPAASITMSDLSNWDLAYSWGDHAAAGYLTSYTAETDPIFSASPAESITSQNIINWNIVYGWGNHSLAGYLTSESDPIFSSSPAASISMSDIGNWDLAYSWGDHATFGYLTSYTETDPIFAAHVASSITSSNITNWNTAYGWGNHAWEGYLISESDPYFSASPAASITSTNIINWNIAHGWGNHALAGYLTSESDPIFLTSAAAAITFSDLSNWDLAYSWGDHAAAGYLTWFTETDPIFSASPAATISSSEINTWNSYVNYWNLTGSDIYVLNRHVGIGTSSPAASLHVANNNVVFTAPFTLPGTPDAPPVSGQGTRMMWYPDKAAFRVGSVQGTNWDRDQIGEYSFASGYNPLASGSGSIAMSGQATGDNSIALASGQATGDRSIAIGTWAIATNSGSVAIGEDVDANGQHSSAFGFQTVADGNYSTVMGLNTRTSGGGYGATAMGSSSYASNHGSTAMGADARATGETSTAMGRNTDAIGEYSTAMGNYTTATGYNSLAANMYTTSQSYASTVFGRYNIIAGDSLSWIDTDPLFVLGNGSSTSSRNNALTVFKDGDMEVDGDVTAARFFGDGSGLTGVGGIQCLDWNSSTRRLSIDGCAGDVYISDYWVPNTDDQLLSISGHLLSIEDGNTVTIPDNVNDADASPTNELQALSFSGYNLSLTSGGTVTLPWANNGSLYSYSFRNIGINTTTPGSDLVIYDASGFVEMNHDNISMYNEGVEKVSIQTSTGNPGWIGTKGPGDSWNTVLGFINGYEDFGSIGVLNDGNMFRAGMQVNSNGTGTMYVQGPNDNDNFLATYYSPTYPNNGWASVNDASGIAQAYMYVNSAGDGVVSADIISGTTKTFRIPHPNNPGYDIVYACIEGPEAAAYVRGTAELSNGTVNIIFPDHFQLVASENSMTIMITPLSADSKGLAVVEKSTSGFTVKELSNGTGTYAFDWEAKCVRKGYEDFEPVQESLDMQIAGSQKKSASQTNSDFLAPEAR